MKGYYNTVSSRGQFPALTGLRAIAAFMVFFHHLPLLLWPHVLIGLQLSFFSGVAIFFVLSGFLITYRYYDTLQLSANWLANYFINRFARIYPVYFLVLTVVLLFTKNFNPAYLFQNYTLTHNLPFIIKSQGAAIGPSWSLTVEECFYIFAPVLILFAVRFGLRKLFIIAVAILLLWVYYYRHDTSMLYSIFLSSIFGRFFEFYAGMYLAFIVIDSKNNTSTRSGKYKTLIGVLAFGIASLPLIYISNKTGIGRHIVMIAVNNFILPLPVVYILWGLIQEKTFLSRLLAGRFFQLAGKSSYAFYLLHLPLIELLGRPYLQPILELFGHNLYVAIIFVIAFVLSVIIYTSYERPVNLAIRGKFKALTRQKKLVSTTA